MHRWHITVPDDLAEKVSVHLDGRPLSAFVRRAVEIQLEDVEVRADAKAARRERAVEQALGGDVKRSLRSQDVATRSPAPAEQPRKPSEDPDRHRADYTLPAPRVRSSASRPFRPAPKKGER